MLPSNTPRVEVRNHILTPAEAEVWITILPADSLSDMAVRGRLTGPRCQYATTVEVAYPLSPLPDHLARPGDLTARAIIPEPSFWDPESPFLYEGTVEVWKGGNRWYEAAPSHGLRVLQLGKSGLHLNGRALTVRGVERQRLSAEDALQLRQEGCNTLVSLVSPETVSLWDSADQFGFLVLGRLPDTQSAFELAESLKFHACSLGWLLPSDALRTGALPAAEFARLQSGSGQLLGVELDRHPFDRLPQGIHLIFARQDFLPLPGDVHRPILLKSARTLGMAAATNQATTAPGILGWIAE
jgi:hypothetical protein